MSSEDNPSQVAPASWWKELPPQDQLAAWDSVVPGAGPRILTEAQKIAAHRRRVEWANIAIQSARVLLAGATVVAFIWLAKYFVDHNAPIEGAAVVGAGLAALVAAFLGERKIANSSDGSPKETGKP